jgi:protease-4
MGAPWRDETDEERAKEQELVDAFYEAFVSRVSKGRGLPDATVRDLATGEIWLGEQAVSLGLVDEIGDLERAVELAAEAAGVPARSAPVRLHRSLFGRLAGRFAVTLADAVADEIDARLERRLRT